MCWQNPAAAVFNDLWASTHVLSGKPGHAWQSSVLLAQLGTGCSLCLPSAPALPTTPGLGRQHCLHVYNVQQGSHHSSQGLFCCPQQYGTLCLPKSLPCLPVFSSLHPSYAQTSPVAAQTPSQQKCTKCWVPWRRHQMLVKVVECNVKWWGFNPCAKCTRKQILQGKILSVI